jgi:outer membrane murein-binding lipoprotein Lpp
MIRDLPRNFLGTLAAVLLGALLLAPPATAGLVETEQLAPSVNIEAERARLAAEVARPEAAQKLEAMGVDPAHAAERVKAMTDQEVREMIVKLDAMPAGGAVSDTALILLLVLLLVLLL